MVHRILRFITTRVKHWRKALLFIITFLIITVVDYYSTKNAGISSDQGENATFNLNPNNTKVIDWLCIENQGNTKYFKHTREITANVWFSKHTVYALPSRECVIPQKYFFIQNPKKRQQKIFGFKLTHRRHYMRHQDVNIQDVGYFHTFTEPFEPENFFHLTKQFLFPLHYLIKATNRLDKGLSNHVFYHKPLRRCIKVLNKGVRMRTKGYTPLLQMLGINLHGFGAFVDENLPTRTCYKKAVFSKGVFTEHALDAIEFFQEKLKVKKGICQGKTLTIISRKNYRRLLNEDQLLRVARELGYSAQAVAMERMTFTEQAQLMHCTDILVGVTGAGLQWAYFMRNHSGVIEIGWPQCAWPFFFTGTKDYNSEEQTIRPLNFVQLQNVTCRKNLRAFSVYLNSTFYIDKDFSTQEALKIYQSRKNYQFKLRPVVTVGKLFDIYVNPIAFKQAIMDAKPTYQAYS